MHNVIYHVDMAITPCPWIEDPDVAPVCIDEATWLAVPLATREMALAYATTIIWSSTGRQFGVCTQTVRPCGWRNCNGGVEWFGAIWQGSTWVPYLWDGQWFNALCACDGFCCCIPDCSVRLEGPVIAITEVTIDSIVVDPATYFVYDQQWLTRVKGNDCWPTCSDLNLAPGEGWEVTYTRGRPVPAELIWAVGTLAWQFILACNSDASCRITNGRIISMSRQGADYQFVSFNEMLEFGWTGVAEVDQLIAAYNPYGLKAPLLVLSPELRYPRQITWP